MMKKLLSLLLVLTLLLPCMPVQAFAASDQSEVLQYGSVDAAMDAYAQKALRSYKSRFSQMTAENFLAFRMTVDEVYGRDNHDDEPNWLMENLVTLGFTVTENDNVWLLSKNQIELDLKYLLMLAQMDAMPFEDAVKQVQTYMPEYNLGMATLGLAADVFVNLLGAKLGDMVKADALMYAPEMLSAGDKLRSGGFFSKTLAKALDYTVIKYGDIYSTAANLGDAAKNLSAYTKNDPALVNLVSSVNQVTSGSAFLKAMQSGGLTDPELSKACQMLSSAYDAFLNELDELGESPDLHEKLQDEDYLSDRFDMLISQELSDYISGTDVMTAAASGALTLIDVWQGGWGNLILKGGTNVLGEAAFGTTSTYTHFHAMLTLDRMYAAMAASTSSGASWEDMAAYARNIQRLCSIALLGETHVYQLSSDDLSAGQKLWLMLKYDTSVEDVLARNQAWYNQRVEYLHGVYNAAQEYLDSLYEHYDKLCLEAADLSPLWGYSSKLTGTFSGVVTEDKWFALPDGSGPDLDNPNPEADEPVEGITVYLTSEGETIASAVTNKEGRYTLTYPLYAVNNRPLSLVIGDTQQDDFLVKENVSSPNYHSTPFRSSYRWNVDTETREEQSAAEQTFPLPYADDYFLTSSLKYNHNLALASLGLAAAAMTDPATDSAWMGSSSAGRDGNICAAWSSLGYQVVASSGYSGNLNAVNNDPAYTIAVKTFEDPDNRTNGIEPKQYRVIGVAIRGDVDAAELAHTLMVAGADSTYAGNVRSAATEILAVLERTINSGYSPEVPTMVWITGFSRGGAIAGQLSDLIRLRSSVNSKIRGLYTYTFGAPGSSRGSYSVSTSTSGIFNIVYEEDWIANGLLNSLRYKAPGQVLKFGEAQANRGRYLVASAFHDLTDGNSAYDPVNYTADPTVRTFLSGVDEAQSDTLYVKELQPLVTAILQASFLRSDTSSDFRTLSLQDKHKQVIAITGMNRVVLNSSSTADDTLTTSSIEKMLDQALTGTSAAFFAALPEDVQQNLTDYLGDILRLAAKNSGKGSAFQLSEDMAEIFLPLVFTLGDDFGSPTSLYSCLYAHHPEIYMAWMLGQSGEELFALDDPDVFNTSILPVDKNLLGTVIDAESKKPIVGAPVHIQGGYGEDAVNRTLYTDEEGKWATFVKPADYTVTFELPGYEPKETRIYQSEHLINTLSNHTGVPVTKSQLEIDRVEMETELQALEHDSIVITTTTRYETGDFYRIEIVHPYVYSTKNPALYSIVESIIGPIFDKSHAAASKLSGSSHNGCAWDMRYHEEDWLYMATAYATDDVLSFSIHSGGFSCGIGHNMNTRYGYTFDIATGKRLTLDDILDPANPNAKNDLQAQITQACKETSRPYDLSQSYSASQIYKSVSQQKTIYTWYMLNDGVEMLVPTLIGGGQDGIFIPYTRLKGIVDPKYLPVENIGSAQVKAVRRENLLKDYDGQLIYNDNGESTTGVQLDGLATHVWVDERTSSPVSSCGKYFYGYKVKDVTVMMPKYEGSVGVVWTDYLGDHFETISVLPEPVVEDSLPEDEYLP